MSKVFEQKVQGRRTRRWFAGRRIVPARRGDVEALRGAGALFTLYAPTCTVNATANGHVQFINICTINISQDDPFDVQTSLSRENWVVK